jgi:peptide/nickel transport system permease protein
MKRIWKRFCKHRFAMAGLFIVGLMLLCAIFAPFLAPADPNAISRDFESPPGKGHSLGTDNVGRDVLSRLIYASRVSALVGIGSAAVSTLIGLFLGLEAGFLGGAADAVIMRFADVFMSFPGLILIMVIQTISGPGLEKVILYLGVFGWPQAARLVRGSVLAVKETDYVKSAVILGFGPPRIAVFHILPNIAGPILVQATFGVASAILIESALSFLGLGVSPPTASWGNMLTDSQSLTTLTSRPWLWIPPGVMILLCVLAFNFVGDGLRDALDPKS